MRAAGARRIALLLVLLALGRPLSAQTLARIQPKVLAKIGEFRGVLGLAVIDLRTGETMSVRGDEQFPTASIIKLPLLVEVFHQMKYGRLHWQDPLVMLEADQVGGSGLLQHFAAPHQLTVGDAATLMISISDNTATNLLIDKVGIRAVNARMDTLGFKRTRLHAKVFARARTTIDSAGSATFGLGVTTPNEFARLLVQIYKGQIVSDSSSQKIVELLKLQMVNDRIPRLLPPEATVAHKTGEVDDTRNDCGIVYAKNHDFVFCALTRENQDKRWVSDNAALITIAELARMVYDALVGG
jgi:beta-lactamase class A